MYQFISFVRWFFVYYVPINLTHFLGGKNYIHSLTAFYCFCNNNNTANRPVQPVYKAKEYIPRLFIYFLYIGFVKVYKGRVSSLVTLRENTSLFIDNEQMVVFVNDVAFQFLNVHFQIVYLRSCFALI